MDFVWDTLGILAETSEGLDFPQRPFLEKANAEQKDKDASKEKEEEGEVDKEEGEDEVGEEGEVNGSVDGGDGG